MGKMIIDLQIACEQESGLPTAQQIEQWATAAVQPQSDEVEMTVRIVDEAETRKTSHGALGAHGGTRQFTFAWLRSH